MRYCLMVLIQNTVRTLHSEVYIKIYISDRNNTF